jgi:hypothetical protein
MRTLVRDGGARLVVLIEDTRQGCIVAILVRSWDG